MKRNYSFEKRQKELAKKKKKEEKKQRKMARKHDVEEDGASVDDGSVEAETAPAASTAQNTTES